VRASARVSAAQARGATSGVRARDDARARARTFERILALLGVCEQRPRVRHVGRQPARVGLFERRELRKQRALLVVALAQGGPAGKDVGLVERDEEVGEPHLLSTQQRQVGREHRHHAQRARDVDDRVDFVGPRAALRVDGSVERGVELALEVGEALEVGLALSHARRHAVVLPPPEAKVEHREDEQMRNQNGCHLLLNLLPQHGANTPKY
jgi:hypothetical protein